MDLERNLEIRSPQEFIEVLRRVRSALASGSLCQFKPVDAPFAMDDITVVNDAGPWPDYVEAYFEDPATRARYKLTAETYHGAGGRWVRL